MKIVAWNIRAGGGKRIALIARQLGYWRADVICLCEFRGTSASQWLAKHLRNQGFVHQINSSNLQFPAKNALLLASKYPLNIIQNKGPTMPERWILAKVEADIPFTIGQMHAPNYTSPELKYPYLDAVKDLADTWSDGPALLLGDTNCGKRLIDEEGTSTTLFRREHDWIESLEASGWTDSFRTLHGLRRQFSWYSHRFNGFRLDQAYLSPGYANAAQACRYRWGKDRENPTRRDAVSDHAALILELNFSQI